VVKLGEATIFSSFSPCESIFLRASSVEPFYFTPFGRKRLQTAPEAAGEALPNGA
jgi:hypothetical protein